MNRKKNGQPSEHAEQATFIQWCDLHGYEYPELTRVFAIPNGGFRSAKTAGELKAEGVRAGVPDLCLPVPRGPYHGLYMETKVPPNKPTLHQIEWITFLEAQGYAAAVCYGCAGLIETVTWYLALPPCSNPKS